MGYTIKDIAEELGVSPTTVSLIINDRPCRVSAATRKAVLDLVEKYNYTPNSSARALVTKKTQTIGLIVPDISNPFFSELAKGVERAANKQGYSTILCNSDNSGKKDLKNAMLLMSKQVDGVIIIPSFTESDVEEISAFRKQVQSNKLPLVLADRTIPFCSYNCVSTNNQLGGHLATEHLIELGHKKIGCIVGANVDSSQKRYAGYTDALSISGIALDDKLVFQGDYQMDSGADGAAYLVEQGVSAIFACNDMMALGCLKQLRQMGYLPGKDISVIGFDDIPLCEFIDTPLTTVNQSLYEVGKNAFRLILDLLEHPGSRTENIMLTPSVIDRSTTGPASR